jgi:hypothetical protein
VSYLRNILKNVVTAELSSESPVYRALIAQRTTASSNTVTVDPSVQMEEGTSTYTIGANEPVWEEIPSERAVTFASRVLAGVLDPAAVAVDTRAILSPALSTDITITAVEYTPVAAVKGAATNFRTISVITAPEAASPVTAAKLALEAGINLVAGEENTITLEEAAKLKAKAGVSVVAASTHSGTGIADPGGIVLVTYTHD